MDDKAEDDKKSSSATLGSKRKQEEDGNLEIPSKKKPANTQERISVDEDAVEKTFIDKNIQTDMTSGHISSLWNAVEVLIDAQVSMLKLNSAKMPEEPKWLKNRNGPENQETAADSGNAEQVKMWEEMKEKIRKTVMAPTM